MINQIIDLCFIEGTLNEKIYLEFLRNELPLLLHDIPLYYQERMWFQHNGYSIMRETYRMLWTKSFPIAE